MKNNILKLLLVVISITLSSCAQMIQGFLNSILHPKETCEQCEVVNGIGQVRWNASACGDQISGMKIRCELMKNEWGKLESNMTIRYSTFEQEK